VQPVLFDTSIYIRFLRVGDSSAQARRWLNGETPIWLSSVVLEELWAGAVVARAVRVIERLERNFDRINRILVPNLTDWTHAGRILAHLAEKYDYEEIGRGRLTNDALIATSAGRLGIRVITANERDFRRLAEFRSFQWEVLP
jgi:predicted nucleic acid-binding protein